MSNANYHGLFDHRQVYTEASIYILIYVFEAPQFMISFAMTPYANIPASSPIAEELVFNSVIVPVFLE